MILYGVITSYSHVACL